MKQSAQEAPTLTWDELKGLTLEGLDQNDAGIQHASCRWEADFQRILRAWDEEDRHHAFQAPEVRAAMVDYFKADIAENVALYNAQVARNGRLAAMVRLEVALGEHDGAFVDKESGDDIVPELQGIMRVSKQARLQKHRQLVKASVSLAKRLNGEDGEGIEFPRSIGEGVEIFERDLSEILAAGGEEARSLVLRLTSDLDIAKCVESDPDMPNPLKFLAGIVSKVWTEIPAAQCDRKLGFSMESRSA